MAHRTVMAQSRTACQRWHRAHLEEMKKYRVPVTLRLAALEATLPLLMLVACSQLGGAPSTPTPAPTTTSTPAPTVAGPLDPRAAECFVTTAGSIAPILGISPELDESQEPAFVVLFDGPVDLPFTGAPPGPVGASKRRRVRRRWRPAEPLRERRHHRLARVVHRRPLDELELLEWLPAVAKGRPGISSAVMRDLQNGRLAPTVGGEERQSGDCGEQVRAV